MRRGPARRRRSGPHPDFPRAAGSHQRKRPRAQRLSSSWAHGGWKPRDRDAAQSVKGKSMVLLPSTVAFNPEVSLTPYLSGTSFLAALTAFW